MTGKVAVIGVAVVLAVCVWAGRAQSQASLGKITLGLAVAQTFEYLPAHAAEDLGTWKKRGLDVSIVAFPGEARLLQAFAAQGVDIGLGSASGGLLATSRGQDVRLIGAISNTISLSLVVAPEIKTRDDLKGKLIGVTSANAPTDVLVQKLAKSLTGRADGIKRAYLGGFQSQVAALKTHQTQGFVWTLDGIFEVEQQGLGHLLVNFGDELPDFAFESIMTTPKMISGRPDAVRAFLEGWYEAQAHCKANKEYTVALFEKKMETPRDIGARVWDLGAKAWVDNGVFSDHGLQAAGQFLVDSGLIQQIPPVETWVDKRFIPVQWSK
jgi:ABC-type nitrate/sulfonate/bicarbonate transport system substrate-binding protein